MVLLRAALIAALLAPSFFLGAMPAMAQEITAFCGVSGLSETPFSPDNKDCAFDLTVRIAGDIQPGLDKRLEATLSSLTVPNSDIVGLHQAIIVELVSDGGNVFAAIAAGRILRKARVWTTIGIDRYAQSKCASACSLLFIAGANRLFHNRWLDLHRPSLPSSELAGMNLTDIEAGNRQLKQELLAYVDELNVDRRFIDLSYSVPIDTSVALTEYQAREMGAAGMIDSEYDFRKGQMIRDLKLGDDADALFALYLGRAQHVRDCMGKVYRQAMGQGADPIDAMMAAAGVNSECERKAMRAYPLTDNIDADVHLVLYLFAQDS